MPIDLPASPPEAGTCPFRLICFNLGKEDAFLITTPHSAVLIDTGSHENGKELAKTLLELGVERLNCLLLTHFDTDHVGGVHQILKRLTVEQVLESPLCNHNKDSQQHRLVLKKHGVSPDKVRSAEQMQLDGVHYTLLPPRKKHYTQDERNNASLLIHVRHGGNTFLFTGDAREARITEYLDSEPERCDWLKVPHHGHYQRTLPRLLHALTPQYAVITSSDERPEDLRTVDALRQAGCKIALTRLGTVVYYSDGEEIFAVQ
ncbi:MAG: MBL fold metallo-hydrolase [Clostridiales bacterium]|nr:MBL fold metallo-hydrolase [Clostridiales bacterium]